MAAYKLAVPGSAARWLMLPPAPARGCQPKGVDCCTAGWACAGGGATIPSESSPQSAASKANRALPFCVDLGKHPRSDIGLPVLCRVAPPLLQSTGGAILSQERRCWESTIV